MFSLKEMVVYPGHGVAKIERIIEKKVAGLVTQFFELSFLHKDMTILVPVHNAMSVGIRKLSSQENINQIFAFLAEPVIPPHQELVVNWNKRNKEYQRKLQSGNLRDISGIYRDLKYIEMQKELSFGEKYLLQQTETLLIEEIALVKNMKEDKAAEQLRTLVTTVNQRPVGITKNLC